MADIYDRLGATPQPPLWAYPVLFSAVLLLFVATLPMGLDTIPHMLIEALYLLLAAAILIPIRRAGIGVLEVGWLLFVVGRFVDFLDELFVEPQPLVEPYVSDLVTVGSLVFAVIGAAALIKLRERELEDLEQRTDELTLKNRAMDEAPVGITIADMTSEDEPLSYVNEGFSRMTGYDAESTVGTNCRFLQGEQTDTDHVAAMRAAIDDNEPVQKTIRNYRKDGTMFWNEITLAPLRDGDGEVTNYLGFQQDVTERKEYEHRLEEQRDSLDILNQIVRHDIRNDLQVIAGRLDLLADHVGDDGQRYLETVDESIRHAVSLTETARELSESMLDGDHELTNVSLRQPLEGELDEAQATFEEAVINVDGTIPDVVVEGNEMLDSVFRNILMNAVEHNDTAEPTVTVSTSVGSDSVTVAVADNGPGVPADLKDQIFGRGEKGLESDGTGIGMYLAETLVEQYGGDVWVEDNEPRGSVFNVKLPLVEPSKPSLD